MLHSHKKEWNLMNAFFPPNTEFPFSENGKEVVEC